MVVASVERPHVCLLLVRKFFMRLCARAKCTRWKNFAKCSRNINKLTSVITVLQFFRINFTLGASKFSAYFRAH